MQLAALRFLPLALLAWIYLLLRRREWTLSALRAHFPRLLASALLLVPGYNWFLYAGQKQVSPALASLIIGASPAVTYLIAIAAGQEVWQSKKAIGLIIAFSGLAVAVSRGFGGGFELSASPHILLVACASLCTALYTVLIRSLVREHPQTDMMLLNLALGGTFLITLANPALFTTASQLQIQTWSSVAYLMVFGTLGGFYFWFYALKHLPASQVAVFANAMPFFTMIFGYFFFAQPLSWHLVLGGALLSTGIYLTYQVR